MRALRACLLLLTATLGLLSLSACGAATAPPPSQEEALAQVPTLKWETVKRRPFDSTAFTQGLLFRAAKIWLSTGLYGKSRLEEVQLSTGKTLQRHDLAESVFGEGLAWHGDYLYQLTWQNGICYVYEPEPLKLVDRLKYQGEGWGLATNGKELIMSDGSATLFFRDPKTFEIKRRVVVRDSAGPVIRLNELEWIDGKIVANLLSENRVVVIDPHSGQVTAQIDFTPLVEEAVAGEQQERVLNGLAWDPLNRHLLVTGKLWPWLYEVKVEGL